MRWVVVVAGQRRERRLTIQQWSGGAKEGKNKEEEKVESGRVKTLQCWIIKEPLFSPTFHQFQVERHFCSRIEMKAALNCMLIIDRCVIVKEASGAPPPFFLPPHTHHNKRTKTGWSSLNRLNSQDATPQSSFELFSCLIVLVYDQTRPTRSQRDHNLHASTSCLSDKLKASGGEKFDAGFSTLKMRKYTI